MMANVMEKTLSQAIAQRRATPSFDGSRLPDEDLKKILEAGLQAPSGYNMQPWRFVVVQDDETKRLLAQACPKGRPVAEAPVVVVAFSVEEDIPVTIGGYMSAYPLDVAVAVGHLQLAATAEGLGTSWIVDFHADKVRTVLGVPEGIHPLAIIPVGFPAENGGTLAPAEGRKSPDEIIAYNQFAW